MSVPPDVDDGESSPQRAAVSAVLFQGDFDHAPRRANASANADDSFAGPDLIAVEEGASGNFAGLGHRTGRSEGGAQGMFALFAVGRDHHRGDRQTVTYAPSAGHLVNEVAVVANG